MKDLNLALLTAEKHHVPQYLGALAYQVYEQARALGFGEIHYPVVFKAFEDIVGVKVSGGLSDDFKKD